VAEIPPHEVVQHFGRRRPVIGEAPGRVNLIGEHTDYSDGFVLPTVIPQTTTVAVVGNEDGLVRACSHEVPYEQQRATYGIGEEAPRREWVDYVQGVTALARRAGLPVTGFDVLIRSDVPVGGGLSSSAALTVALLQALRTTWDWRVGDEALATMAWRVETDFVGVPCGAMDPFACLIGRPGHALFLDTRTLSWERVELPADLGVAVVSSGISHSHATGAYRTRQQECRSAADSLGLATLRDATDAHAEAIEALPAPIARRARHVVAENARVLQAVDALRCRDLAALGALVNASHASLRDDFEVSTPEMDALVALARAEPGVLGARMTGGGFGGAIVILTRASHARQVADAVAVKARHQLAMAATALVPAAVPGW
jgi:galactokinase